MCIPESCIKLQIFVYKYPNTIIFLFSGGVGFSNLKFSGVIFSRKNAFNEEAIQMGTPLSSTVDLCFVLFLTYPFIFRPIPIYPNLSQFILLSSF